MIGDFGAFTHGDKGGLVIGDWLKSSFLIVKWVSARALLGLKRCE